MGHLSKASQLLRVKLEMKQVVQYTVHALTHLLQAWSLRPEEAQRAAQLYSWAPWLSLCTQKEFSRSLYW